MAGEDKKGYQKAGATGTGTNRVNYTHADVAYVRKKRGSLINSEGCEAEGGELNIVPYLDILINLIMFLLVAQATMVSLGMIDVTAPTYRAPGPDDGASPSDPAKKKLRLTIGIADSGFFIAAKGGVLPGEQPVDPETSEEGVVKREPTIPKTADGKYNFPALAGKLRGIKTAFPDTQAVYVAADAHIAYEVIVKTLDASREDARGLLFPHVAFTQIN